MSIKFADMPIGKRRRWLDWANNHDWGADKATWNPDGSMRVEGSIFHAESQTAEVEIFIARTPQELRAWAGY